MVHGQIHIHRSRPLARFRWLPLIICLLGVIIAGPVSAAPPQTEVRIPSPGSAADISHRFFADLLTTVLARTADRDGAAQVVLQPTSPSQGRILRHLEQNELIDTYWVGTNPIREERLRPVRVPLTGGLLGLRIPVILRERTADFDRISTLQDLRQLTACQGSQWPDSDILEANGLPVLRIIQFRLMYDMLKAGRCDYFPRGLNEVYAEVSSFPDDTFVAYDRLVLAYRYPMYFFTSRDNTALADRLERGLTDMAHSGALWRFMENHPVTHSVFPLDRFRSSALFLLTNPMLPPQTPVRDAALWLPFPGLPHEADFRGNAPLRDGEF